MRFWIDVDADGQIVGSTGLELAGTHALVRSVAVDASLRGSRRGSELAEFALDRARELGATRAWLFSRRSGPFWQKLGFEAVSTTDLAAVLAITQQVRAFTASGQLGREVAWSRAL